MKSVIFLLFVWLICLDCHISAQTQAYEPLVIENARWRVKYGSGLFSDSSCCWVQEYWIEGDTTMDSVRILRYSPEMVDSMAYQVQYKTIFSRDLYISSSTQYFYTPLEEPNVMGFIREDTAERKVFCYDCWMVHTTDNAEEVLYDYSKNEGDTIGYMAVNHGPLVVESIQYIFAHGKSRKRTSLGIGYYPLIEGIGSERGIFERLDVPLYAGFCPFIQDYCIGDDSTCRVAPYILSTPEEVLAESMTLHPNPADELVHISLSVWGSLVEYRVLIRDILGKECANHAVAQAEFDLSLKQLPPGLYLVELWQEDQRIEHKKLIIQQR